MTSPFLGFCSQINSLAYTADGQTIVTSADDTAITGGSSGRALMWDAMTGVDIDVHVMNVRESAMRALSTHEGETLMVKVSHYDCGLLPLSDMPLLT